jgi:penicillin-binding protein 1C
MRMPEPLGGAPWSTALLDREGRLLGASIASDGQWRFPPDRDPPERFVQALVAFEDDGFYSHRGVDPAAIVRAFFQNAAKGEVVSGASTLSMQVIRALRAKSGRGLGDKIIEALGALRLEVDYPKDDILRFYAALAPFGGNVVGAEAASWRWFGRDFADLSWAEAATLAVLPNAPSLMHPGKGREALKAKRDGLLRKLAAKGAMSAFDLELALEEPIPERPSELPRLVPHLLERVRRELGEGVRVRSSIDLGVQELAARVAERTIEGYAGRGIRNAAVVVLDVPTGETLAYVGNVAGGESPYVDCANALRSSGSILKPFLYSAMLDSGAILPDSLVIDIPTRIGGFIPENNTGAFSGAMPARLALARSLNVPAVRELRDYGVDRFYRFLKDFGMGSLFRPARDYGLSLILGGAESRLYEAAGMFASLARVALADGPEAEAYAVRAPTYLLGARPKGLGSPILSAASAWLCMEALTELNRPGPDAQWRDYASGRKIAWKTGTSYGYRDAWAVGCNTRHAIAVWVGNASGEPRPELGGFSAAAPILFGVLDGLPRGDWFPMPREGLSYVTTCAHSGFPAGPDCADRSVCLAPSAASAAPACPYCRPVTLDAEGRYRVWRDEEPGAITVSRFVLPPAVEWYYRPLNYGYEPLPPYKPGSSRPKPLASMSLVSPDEGAELYIPIELDGSPGMAVFQAAHRDAGAVIHWHLDGSYIASTTSPHTLELRPEPGAHSLALVSDDGEIVERSFKVLAR